MSFNQFTLEWQRITDNLMLWHEMQVNKPQLRVGVQVVQCHVSLEFQVEELTDPAKELLVTCAVVVVCFVQTKFGEDGTYASTKTSADMQLSPHWLLLQSLPL
jgi:hypothetical protein